MNCRVSVAEGQEIVVRMWDVRLSEIGTVKVSANNEIVDERHEINYKKGR